MEQVAWINTIISQSWPYVNGLVSEILRGDVEHNINKKMPSVFQPFQFETIDVGTKPPTLEWVQVYEELVPKDKIIMDIMMSYKSNTEIEVSITGIDAGIQDLTISGLMRIIISPLIEGIPLFGGLSIFFLEQPKISFDLNGAANVLDLPILRSKLREAIDEEINNALVIPNKIPISLSPKVDKYDVQFLKPPGVIRFQCIDAVDLMQTDINITGKADPDPYVIIKYEGQSKKSKIINDTSKPIWNEYIEFIADQIHQEELKVELWDDDIGSDDYLGKMTVKVEDIVRNGTHQKWFTLSEAKKGRFHFETKWCELSSDIKLLQPILSSLHVSEGSQVRGQRSSALFSIILKEATNLPRLHQIASNLLQGLNKLATCCCGVEEGLCGMRKKPSKKPMSMDVKVLIGEEEFTKKEMSYKESHLNIAFNCTKLLQDPRGIPIHIEAQDHDTSDLIGVIDLNTDDILNSPQLELDDIYTLTGSDEGPCMTVKSQIWILVPKEAT